VGTSSNYVNFGDASIAAFCDSTPNCDGGMVIQFNGAGSTVVAPPAAGISLGSFRVQAQGDLTDAITGTAAFTLTIQQTSPTPGSGDLTATVSGTFIIRGGSGSVSFDQNSVTIAGITYTLNNGDGVIQLNAAGDPNDPTTEGWGTPSTVEAKVNLSSVPEPASLALFGSGLVVGGNFLRRKIAA
jgi:hypothetical protein